ncbi:L-histidine N(alpha)-methyltransferase [Lysobacter sp. GX 14042]|uniref:L-histidine N(alpha)-methyltransferase n=1 Tax=Lysobacter sp. GX 14042 TaxID=2907155 RepID=UPI001F33D543|nr:L-histidine N(alpha)-methyltransferase [Lysobacter sp. GX 14042]MCE7032305.1 L-histidine N(alpha)-methyltransferase [Lysobacter sp. GX 14042]
MSVRYRLTDLQPRPHDLAADAVAGLSSRPRSLPSKYFYDDRGSALFESITRQPEYYLTRMETALLRARMPEIAAALGGGGLHLVEYGSGSGYKTGLLLEGLDRVIAYTPVEISRNALLASVGRLAARFPAVEMLPVCADFTGPVPLPEPARPAGSRLVFFPGSTLGNFVRPEAVGLLQSMRRTMGEGGVALVGIDLDKDPAVIEAAYNDAAGVTARFTLNLLHRLNRELGGDFDPTGFVHRAHYSTERRRIETDLVSLRRQQARIGGQRFDFEEGEAIRVEYSHKYTDDDFAEMCAAAGLQVARSWNDRDDWFGLRLLQPAE